MSDHSISIVPKQSVYPDKETKAKEILDWLVSRDIVKPKLSHCVLSSNEGYAISNGARAVSSEPEHLPFGLGANGLEIITKRQVFHTGENEIEEIICPKCNQDISTDEWDLTPWAENETNNLFCPLCNVGTDINQFKFTPHWGFSDLGFTFWNWSGFTDKFIDEFKQKLDCEVHLVYSWI